MRVSFCFNFRQINIIYPRKFACPRLDNLVASLFQVSCAFHCGFVPIFARLVVAGNDFFTIARETFLAPVPVAALVLEYSLLFIVAPIHRYALNPTLATMPTHCVVNLDFPPLRFSFKPPQRFLRRPMFWVESLLATCLRFFHIFPRAIFYHFSLTAGLEMSFKIVNLCESSSAMWA